MSSTCPYCDFHGPRTSVHTHLAATHSDVLGWEVDERFGHTACVVTCPLCGASHSQVVRKARKNPGFIQEYEYEIRLVVFDLLLYHLQGEHNR
ncbi:MAG: hypothetical protein M5U01_39275 [Ardenticatenaceae bacterium]|nr:hypothetical protein [Ardenticatenaceae bacterium]HBY92859.1 hypothetical protein [Chloroflexota bacterium]